MKNTNNILLVRVPAKGTVDCRELRDYILESLAKGVLVLNEYASYEVMELPSLGGVEVRDVGSVDQPVVEAAADSPPENSEEASEKRAILQRLADFRKANGLGCLERVSEKTAHFKADRLPVETLRMIITGAVPKIAMSEWRKIARALDALEDSGTADQS